VRTDGLVVHSLTAHAIAAMERHKWIESEKARCDLGTPAVLDWVDRYWTGFVRARMMEHLYGWRCWGAFADGDFGLLVRTTVDYHVPRAILDHVALILREGGENLDVIAAATAKAKKLGAKVMKDVTEVMGMGSLSIITDPSGANLGLWQPKRK
ncbi:MAG: hypothetical protein ACREDP_03075, partial [Bradyrhizobium sp.]